MTGECRDQIKVYWKINIISRAGYYGVIILISLHLVVLFLSTLYVLWAFDVALTPVTEYIKGLALIFSFRTILLAIAPVAPMIFIGVFKYSGLKLLFKLGGVPSSRKWYTKIPMLVVLTQVALFIYALLQVPIVYDIAFNVIKSTFYRGMFAGEYTFIDPFWRLNYLIKRSDWIYSEIEYVIFQIDVLVFIGTVLFTVSAITLMRLVEHLVSKYHYRLELALFTFSILLMIIYSAIRVAGYSGLPLELLLIASFLLYAYSFSKICELVLFEATRS